MKKNITRLLKYGTLIGTLGFVLTTIFQIYGRFFIEKPPSWTEEASRFFFIYATSFAAGLAMKDKSYVFFDGLFNKLSSSIKLKIEIISNIVTLILFLLIAFYSVHFLLLGIPENSPSIGLPMAVAFSSILVMGISISYYAFLDLLKLLNRKK